MQRTWTFAADGQLFSEEQRARMLVALLGVGIVLSVPTIVGNATHGGHAALATEATLVAGKLACLVWVLRARARSSVAVGAVVAFTSVCATASNLLYPGHFRPFTAQLLLSVLFVSWFLAGRHRLAQLVLIAAAAAASLIDATPPGAEALRLMTLVLTGATIAVLASALRDRHAQLSAHASADALTGIGNRRAYEDAVATALAHARRFEEPVSLVLLDLDGFKELNDTLGHPAGDAELQAVARLLTRRAREQDAVFRLGGDEFAVLLPGTAAAGAVRFAHDVTEGDLGLRTSMTAGVAEYPEHGANAEDLFHAADRGLLAGKRAGKAQVRSADGAPGDART